MKLYSWGGEREEKRIKEKIGKPTTRARSHAQDKRTSSRRRISS
jgi:hypothetical protein